MKPASRRRPGTMVKISDFLQEDLVLDDIKAADQEGVLSEFAGALARAGMFPDGAEIVRVLAEREALGSTGIGEGVAIPHGKLRGLRRMLIAFGRSRTGVDFRSLDGRPVHLFFVLVTPEEQPGEHLKALARISRILKNPVLRKNLLAADRPQDLRRMIIEEDGRYCAK